MTFRAYLRWIVRGVLTFPRPQSIDDADEGVQKVIIQGHSSILWFPWNNIRGLQLPCNLCQPVISGRRTILSYLFTSLPVIISLIASSFIFVLCIPFYNSLRFHLFRYIKGDIPKRQRRSKGMTERKSIRKKKAKKTMIKGEREDNDPRERRKHLLWLRIAACPPSMRGDCVVKLVPPRRV